jgi:hypothetical protein
VSTGLVVAIVIALVLAVVAVIVFLVFRSRRTADDYGAIPVPGETTVTITVGKLRLTYQESYRAGGTEGTIDFGVPSALDVTVTAPTGEPLGIEDPDFYVLNTGSGWSRALIGTARITQPGKYTITAGGDLPHAIEPQVLIGR